MEVSSSDSQSQDLCRGCLTVGGECWGHQGMPPSTGETRTHPPLLHQPQTTLTTTSVEMDKTLLLQRPSTERQKTQLDVL